MTVDQEGLSSPPERESRAGPNPETDALEQLKAIVRASSGIVQDFLELLGLEGQLAGRSLAAMLMLAVVLALLLVSVWLFAFAALGFWLIAGGYLSAPVSLLVVAAINATLALAVWFAIVRLSRNLMFREFLSALSSLLPAASGEEKQ